MTEEEMLARVKPGCICKGIRLYKILEAIDGGADSYEKIAAITGIGGGSCKSRRCREKVAQLLEKKHITVPEFER